MTDAIENRILYAVFCMSRDTLAIDAGSLGRVVNTSATQAARALVRLERAGLIDATRARLTMLGLAAAAAAGSALGGTGIDLTRAHPAAPVARAPLAAGPAVAERPAVAARPALSAPVTHALPL